MKTILFSILSTLLFGTLFFQSSCTKSKNQNLATPTPPVSAILLQPGRTLEQVKANDVPYRLYQLLSATTQNINFSPLSLDMTFALVYEGSDGKTRQMLQQIFNFPVEGGNYAFAKELSAIKSPSVELYFGNSVWSKHPKLVLEGYKKTIADRLNASVKPLELNKMNEWVSDTTKGKIKTFLKSLPNRIEAVFINTLYLRAPWATPFNPASTHSALFQPSQYASVRAQMMGAKESFPYYEDDQAKWIELPYRDSTLVMDLALPQKRFNLRSVEDKLSTEYLNQVYSKFAVEKIDLQLPKFKFNTSLSLMQVFIDAGYVDLFKDGNFSRFENTNQLSVSDIIQATAIAVDETGTTAAAATAVTVHRALIAFNVKKFTADQPFLYLIRNTKSGEIYFMGRVFDPHLEN